jgi:hypothetical protein
LGTCQPIRLNRQLLRPNRDYQSFAISPNAEIDLISHLLFKNFSLQLARGADRNPVHLGDYIGWPEIALGGGGIRLNGSDYNPFVHTFENVAPVLSIQRFNDDA